MVADVSKELTAPFLRPERKPGNYAVFMMLA
jgi:hypothetical protein